MNVKRLLQYSRFFEAFPLFCPKGKWKMFFRWKTFLHGPSSLGKLVFLSPCCPQTLLNLLHPSQFQQKKYRVECCKNTKYKNTKYFVDCREKQNWKIKNTLGLRKFKMCNILEENTFTCMYSNNRVGEEVHLTVKWNWSASKVKSWGEGVDLEVKVTSPVHFNTIEIWGDSLFSQQEHIPPSLSTKTKTKKLLSTNVALLDLKLAKVGALSHLCVWSPHPSSWLLKMQILSKVFAIWYFSW